MTPRMFPKGSTTEAVTNRASPRREGRGAAYALRTGGLSTLCVEVDVNDRGAFLFAEHDERDSFSRPYGECYRLVEEVVVVRDFLLNVLRERVYRQFFTSDGPRDAQVALRKGHPHRNADTEVHSEDRQYD